MRSRYCPKAVQTLGSSLPGEGPLRSELDSLIQHLGIGEQVSLLGLRQDVPALYAASDAFVLSSAWEGMPNVVLEAMAALTPVVATSVGAVPEVITDGKSGLIVPPHDHDALANAMEKVMEMPAQTRQAFGRAGYNRVLADFSRESVIDKWEDLFNRLLAGKSLTEQSMDPTSQLPASVAIVSNSDESLYRFHNPIMKALVHAGLKVYAVSPPGPFVSDMENLGVEFVPWGLSRRSLNPFTEFASLVRLVRIYRRVRPDIVQHFTVKPNVYGAIAARLAGIPVVFSGVQGLGYALWRRRRNARRASRRPVGALQVDCSAE